jgi:tRNA-modifying protein YgfZ
MDAAGITYADRSERGKLRFTGPQAAWFLHQVLTQAFEDMEPGEARDAAMITAHGRMIGYLEALALDDAIVCHLEPELRATFPDALSRYVFATQVEIDDVTERFGLVLVVGERWRDAGRAAAPDAPLHETSSLGVSAGYLWVERERVPEVLGALEDAGAKATDEDDLEALRIAQGVPRWGREMDAKTIPQEAGIEGRVVHFDKGCYLGQEAMAKIAFRGKVNRRLARLRADAVLEPGVTVELDGTPVGTVTSASDGRALAIVRHTVAPGTVVSAGPARADVVS